MVDKATVFRLGFFLYIINPYFRDLQFVDLVFVQVKKGRKLVVKTPVPFSPTIKKALALRLRVKLLPKNFCVLNGQIVMLFMVSKFVLMRNSYVVANHYL